VENDEDTGPANRSFEEVSRRAEKARARMTVDPPPLALVLLDVHGPSSRSDLSTRMVVTAHPWDLFGAGSAGLVTAWVDHDGAGCPDVFGRLACPPHASTTSSRSWLPVLDPEAGVSRPLRSAPGCGATAVTRRRRRG
jgi:hypothetical protein